MGAENKFILICDTEQLQSGSGQARKSFCQAAWGPEARYRVIFSLEGGVRSQALLHGTEMCPLSNQRIRPSSPTTDLQKEEDPEQ